MTGAFRVMKLSLRKTTLNIMNTMNIRSSLYVTDGMLDRFI